MLRPILPIIRMVEFGLFAIYNQNNWDPDVWVPMYWVLLASGLFVGALETVIQEKYSTPDNIKDFIKL
ncbi:MAG: hypothetical protein KatS3mg087_2079 [Patescibacteria group bacterium]|nr:MAG: hypothetical protein KatS3mg087_2079 [Patescibacteria group bacterium]